MLDSIAFPHLHIELPHVGQDLSVFGLSIAYYGIVIALAMLAGSSLVLYLARKTGQDENWYADHILITLVLGVLGARAYYVIFTWSYYREHLPEIFDLRGGGLGIFGGILTGIAVTVWRSRHHHKDLLLVMDTAIPGVALGQSIGRWGNFFNREAFGEYTDSLLAMRLPLERVAADDVTEKMLQHVQEIKGTAFIQVHPTFLYESLWTLGTVLILLAVQRKIRHRDGQVFCLYLILYGAGRAWIEGLRTDQLLLWRTGIPVSQLVSGLMLSAGLAGIVVLQKKARKVTIERKEP